MDRKNRLIHLLGQIWAETGYLRLTKEQGASAAAYAPYVGRGLIQITWQDKYRNYNSFAKITDDSDSDFNLDLISDDKYHAGNSSGYYWISKVYLDPLRERKIGLNQIADKGLDTDTIGELCLWINGGGNHYDHRHIHFFYVKRILDDVAYEDALVVEFLTFFKMEFVRETPIVNGHPKIKIIGTQRSGNSMDISIDHKYQR